MRTLFYVLIFVSVASCNNSGQSNAKTEGEGSKSQSLSTASQNIRNDVSVKGDGLTVQQAFLMFEDGRLVPQDNKVEVGQQVNLRLIIAGWETKNGKVLLDASEKITTDDGQVILDEKDLFAAYPDGVDAAAAGVITLSAVITRVDKLFKYFEVSFRVWDKAGSDNITGSYKLYLK